MEMSAPPPKLLIIYNFKSQDGNYNVYYNTIVSWVYYNTVNEVQYNTVPGDQAGLQAGLQRTSGALKSPDPGFKPEMSGSRFQTWNVRIQVSNLEIYGREYNIILINRWPWKDLIRLPIYTTISSSSGVIKSLSFSISPRYIAPSRLA